MPQKHQLRLNQLVAFLVGVVPLGHRHVQVDVRAKSLEVDVVGFREGDQVDRLKAVLLVLVAAPIVHHEIVLLDVHLGQGADLVRVDVEVFHVLPLLDVGQPVDLRLLQAQRDFVLELGIQVEEMERDE